jgi:hypothetical protein
MFSPPRTMTSSARPARNRKPCASSHQGVAHGVELHAAQIDETALRISPHGMLDLDDVCAPVGQDRAGGGHKRELRDLQHPDSFHYQRHNYPVDSVA